MARVFDKTAAAAARFAYNLMITDELLGVEFIHRARGLAGTFLYAVPWRAFVTPLDRYYSAQSK
jgi:hypothetical protein